MIIAIIFCVVFLGLMMIQITITDYLRFYRDYRLPLVWFRMPPDPPQVSHLQQLWEARRK